MRALQGVPAPFWHRLFAVWVVAITSVVVASLAHAHAIVTRTSLDEAPVKADTATTVTLYLNSRVEAKFTKVVLVDSKQQERDVESSLGESGDTVTVRLPPLASGTYGLRYKVLAVDGHVTENMVRFRVQSSD